MEKFAEAMLVGLGNGSTISLIAVGFVVVFKSTGVLNFAQPALMVGGGYLVSAFAVTQGLNFFVAVAVAVGVTVLVGAIIERLTMRPLVGESAFTAAVVTVGVDIVLRTAANRRIGPFLRPVGDPWGLRTVSIGSIDTQQRYLVMLAVMVVVVAALYLFFQRSRIGLAMRTTALDQEVSLAQGINVGRMFTVAWLIAGALAALGGVFVGSGSGIDQQSHVVAFKALPAIILGGMDSIGGAVIGGLAIGVVEALVATYQGDQPGQFAGFLGTSFSSIAGFVVMLVVLMVRPYGLFGTREVERV